MPKRGSKRKKTRTHAKEVVNGATVISEDGRQESLEKDSIPRSIVAKASKVIVEVGELVRDLRKLMGPYTANNLREKKYNRMKDYTAVAGQLGVTHLLTISQTKKHIVLRVGRTPSGPTLHFHVIHYSLARQVRSLQKRPFESPAAYMAPPLVVLNNFGQAEEQHVKLMRVTFQNMFPSINVKTVRLSECRRVVLFHYRKEDGMVEMRHFAIRAQPVGISSNVKKILQAKIPNLGDLQDVSEFLEGTNGGPAGGGAASDSEMEDEGARVVLPERYLGKGNAKSQQSAMKLSELGPRLTLDLFKVERGICEGDVIYHKFVTKSVAEDAATKKKIETQKMLKEERKATQAENVKRKRALEEEKRKEKFERKKAKYGEQGEGGGASATAGKEGEDEEDMGEADDEDDGEDDGDDEDEDDDDDDDEDEDGGGRKRSAYEEDSEVDEAFLDSDEDDEG